MKVEIRDILERLISIPSPFFYEDEILLYLEDLIGSLGFHTQRQRVKRTAMIDGRIRQFEHYNLLGEKGRGRNGFLLYGHIDTVPVVEAWSDMGLSPFEPVFSDGKIYGLGACDMKGGVAAIIKAVSEIEPIDYTLKICFGVDEENESMGAHILVNSDFLHNCRGCIVPEVGSGRAPQASENIVIGRHGRNRVGIKVKGHAAHASTPEYILNPVEYALEVIQHAKNIDFGDDPDMPPGNISIGGIQSMGGGLSSPEECIIWFDNLYLNPKKSGDMFGQYRDICKELNKKYSHMEIGTENDRKYGNIVFTTLDPTRMASDDERKYGKRSTPFMEPWKIAKDHPLALSAAAVVKSHTGKDAVMTCGKSNADENYIGQLVPTIGIPPMGGGEHQGGEYVVLTSLEKAASIIRDTVAEYMRSEQSK